MTRRRPLDMATKTLRISASDQRRYERICDLLARLDSFTLQRAAVLMVLSDDTTPNDVFTTLRKAGQPLSAAARTSQIFKHAARMLRMKAGKKIDRETRDYAIRPLRADLKLVQKAYVVPVDEIEDGQLVIHGRHKTKSPNNAYVLTDDARRLIIELPDDAYEAERDQWLSADNQRRLRLLQKQTADLTISSDHSDLIDAMWLAMSRKKCAQYECVFIDDADGERISDRWRPRLEELGLLLDLDSVWPDLMAVKADEKKIWFFDAVVSDGEIDDDRRDQMIEWSAARGWEVAGMTTGYLAWEATGRRQGQQSNLAVGTSVWIAKDGGKLYGPIESLAD